MVIMTRAVHRCTAPGRRCNSCGAVLVGQPAVGLFGAAERGDPASWVWLCPRCVLRNPECAAWKGPWAEQARAHARRLLGEPGE